MPLRWDPLLVRALARELHDRLAGARLRAIRLDGNDRDMTLLFREATLWWSLHPQRGAPVLLPASEPAPGDLPLASRVRRVWAPADERLLVMELAPQRGSGPRELVVELLDNQWNALVVEGPERRIRHVLVRRDAPRPARVGSTYAPPEPSPRAGAEGNLDAAAWRALVESAPPPDRPRALVAATAWTSALNRRALVDGDPDPASALERGHRLWRSWVDGVDTEPVLLETARGLQPYPWPLPDVPARRFPTLLDAFRAWSEEASPHGAVQEAAFPGELLEALEGRLDAAARRRTSLVAELAGLEDPAALRGRGDLLLARFHEVPDGAASVTLDDFEGRPVTLELDPTRPPQENARAYYDRAAKAERAAERLPGLLEDVSREADRLEALLARVRTGEATADEVCAALPDTPPRDRKAPEPGASLPYRVFTSSGGLEIRVGRGSKHNDALTFRHSAPDDIWLHARQAAGAHVILRWGRAENPPARDLEEAAVLAALHSKARTSGTVAVAWTRRKYVRKPRGAAPGSVVPQRTATVFVEPDEGLMERLSRD